MSKGETMGSKGETMGERWTIEGGILTVMLPDGPVAGTYSLPVPAVQQHPQAGAVLLIGSRDDKPVYLRLATRPDLAAALESYEAAARDRYLSEQIRCERCGQHVDGRSCYRQQEWARIGGSRIKATAYYCAACASLLHMIGMGERSAMDERAAERPDMTPETKED